MGGLKNEGRYKRKKVSRSEDEKVRRFAVGGWRLEARRCAPFEVGGLRRKRC